MHIIHYLKTIHQALNEAEIAIANKDDQRAKKYTNTAFNLFELRYAYLKELSHTVYAKNMGEAMMKYTDQIIRLHFSDADWLVSLFAIYLEHNELANATGTLLAVNNKIEDIRSLYLNAVKQGIERTDPYMNMQHKLSTLILNLGKLLVGYLNREQQVASPQAKAIQVSESQDLPGLNKPQTQNTPTEIKSKIPFRVCHFGVVKSSVQPAIDELNSSSQVSPGL
jgi:hypothetical protein